MTLVSIVTPSYNQVRYLETTLRSVLQQDYQPLEYLVVDGASTDGSVELIRRYAGQLAWWVSEPDRGQAEAINKGLQRSRGEIVAWLNSDDFYLPGAIRQAVAAFEANPQAGMVFGDALSVDEAGRPIKRFAFGGGSFVPGAELQDFLRFRIICQPAVFIRRSVLECAGQLDDRFHMMLDHHLWLRLARCAPVVQIKRTTEPVGAPVSAPLLAAARQHAGAKNMAQAARFSEEIMALLTWILEEPGLAEQVKRDRRRIQGGAYRLAGRYLLDGNQPGEALRFYLRALAAWPSYALKHGPRMAYALVSLVAGERLAGRLRRQLPGGTGRKQLLQALRGAPGLQDWPGLDLS